MKSKINYLGLIAVAGVYILGRKVLNDELNNYWLIVALLPVALIIYQRVFRQKKSTKSMLLSPLNIFSCKSSKTIESELDSDLLLEKVLFEINKVGLKTQYVERGERSILVSTAMNMRTWGENIYFDVIDNGETSALLIQSAAPQVISWGRNDENIERLVHNIEDSFTI
jgi:hypothetical protein